jgi:hypothetical protein
VVSFYDALPLLDAIEGPALFLALRRGVARTLRSSNLWTAEVVYSSGSVFREGSLLLYFNLWYRQDRELTVSYSTEMLCYERAEGHAN